MHRCSRRALDEAMGFWYELSVTFETNQQQQNPSRAIDFLIFFTYKLCPKTHLYKENIVHLCLLLTSNQLNNVAIKLVRNCYLHYFFYFKTFFFKITDIKVASDEKTTTTNCSTAGVKNKISSPVDTGGSTDDRSPITMQ